MKKILIISMLLISSPLFSGHHAKGEMSNAEVVKKAYATFGSGDIEGWKKLHTSDLKFTIFGDLPQSGVHYGADAVITNVFDVIAIHWPMNSNYIKHVCDHCICTIMNARLRKITKDCELQI